MYTQVASRLSIQSGSDPSYSQAVSMAGGNAVYVDITTFSISASTLTVEVEVSNDLENWVKTGASVDFTSAGYDTVAATAISSAYVRLSYSFESTSKAIVAAGVNVANL